MFFDLAHSLLESAASRMLVIVFLSLFCPIRVGSCLLVLSINEYSRREVAELSITPRAVFLWHKHNLKYKNNCISTMKQKYLFFLRLFSVPVLLVCLCINLFRLVLAHSKNRHC